MKNPILKPIENFRMSERLSKTEYFNLRKEIVDLIQELGEKENLREYLLPEFVGPRKSCYRCPVAKWFEAKKTLPRHFSLQIHNHCVVILEGCTGYSSKDPLDIALCRIQLPKKIQEFISEYDLEKGNPFDKYKVA